MSFYHNIFKVPDPQNNALPAVVLALLFCFAGILAFFTYFPSLEHDFVNWDDNVFIYQNDTLTHDIMQFITEDLTSRGHGNWIPLTVLSLKLDHIFWGLNPKGYHLSNIIFHSINSMLVFILMIMLFNAALGKCSTRSVIASVAVSVLFALHPQHVESVAWVTERKDVLYSMFWLLATILYILYARGLKGKRLALLSGCLIMFFFSLVSKPMAVMFPLSLLIIDWYPLKRINSKRDLLMVGLVEKAPFFLLSLIIGIVTINEQQDYGAMKILASIGMIERVLSSAKALVFYIYKFIIPTNLVPLYFHEMNVSMSDWRYSGSVVLIVLITLVFVLMRKRMPYLLAGWIFYIVTVLPTLGLIQVGVQEAADRYMYLPMLGLLIFAGAGIYLLWGEEKGMTRARFITVAVFMLICLASGSLTRAQLQYWRNSISLWSRTLQLYPNNHVASNNLGNAYLDLQQYEKAIEVYTDALSRNTHKAEKLPIQFSELNYNLGIAYQKTGMFTRALEHYKKALSLDDSNIDAQNNIGIVYLDTGDYENAIQVFSTLLESNPTYNIAYINLGEAYFYAGRYAMAIESLEAYLRVNSQYSYYANNLLIQAQAAAGEIGQSMVE